MSSISLIPITAAHDAALASIVRATLAEFGANKPGTVYYDESTDHLSDLFSNKGSMYLLAIEDGELLGGGGLYPTEALPDGCVELVKMYLKTSARGKGIGKLLISTLCEQAKAMGYTEVYLETMPELKQAVSLYEHMGFSYLKAPLGNSGHFGCDIWMLKKL